jgi:hypothetical protein
MYGKGIWYLAPYLDILGGVDKHGVCAAPCAVPLAEAGQNDIPPLQGMRRDLKADAISAHPCSLLPWTGHKPRSSAVWATMETQ